MIITIKAVAPNSGETRLCDGPGRGLDKSVGPSGFGFGEQRNIDMSQPIRALNAIPLDRGNSRLSLTFTIARQCSSMSAATNWAWNHRRLCVRAGTLYITQDNITETYPNTVLIIQSCAVMGVSVQVTYNIITAGVAA